MDQSGKYIMMDGIQNGISGVIMKRSQKDLLKQDLYQRGQHIGDNVDINPLRTHPGWTTGKIRSLHKTSGQCHIGYKHGDKLLYYWAHLDDAEQIAEFESKSKE